MELSQREYARRCGVRRQTIQDGVRSGAIPLTAGGKVDVERADAIWGARRQARRSRVADAAQLEARRRQAELTFTRANMRMLRRKAAKMRAGSISRKKAQARIGAVIAELFARLHAIDGSDPVEAAVKKALLTDLADLPAEAAHVFALLDNEAEAQAD